MSDTYDREDRNEESFDWLSILNNVSQMVWIMKPDGKIIWANQTHLNYFGDTFEELVINNKAWERIHPEDLEKTWDAVQEWRAQKKEKNLEYRLKNKEGIYLWHLAQVTMIRQEDNDANSIKYFVGTITNIHEQKMVDEKAKLFEQQLKAVASHAPVVVWAMDVNGIFTQYIGNSMEILGVSQDHFIGKNVYDFALGNSKMIECLTRSLRGENCSLLGEKYEKKYFDNFYFPVRNHLNEVSGVVGISVDITARKEAEELSIKEKAATEAAKLRSLFLANVSHELRTPLNGIIGLSELLLHDDNQPPLSDQYASSIQLIYSSGTTLLNLIDQILDFSSIDHGHIKLEYIPFSIRSLIEEHIKIVQPSMQSQNKTDKLKLVVDIDACSHEYFEGDPTRIGQILLNFLSNAVKFTEKGTIIITFSCCFHKDYLNEQKDRDEVNMAITSTANSQTVKISVIDNGIGISKESQKLLFTPFAQAAPSTKRQFGGTGLGLSICDKLARLLSGRIGVESEEGKGSTFWFELPLRACTYARYLEFQSTLKSRDILSDGQKLDPRKRRILVAEDHPVNRILLVAILNKLGHEVTAVQNGSEALLAFINSNNNTEVKPYDLVFMDCRMPDLDGYEATKAIRQQEMAVIPGSYRRVPIIAVTADVMNNNHDKCFESGMDDFVSKPITRQQIVLLLEKWLT